MLEEEGGMLLPGGKGTARKAGNLARVASVALLVAVAVGLAAFSFAAPAQPEAMELVSRARQAHMLRRGRRTFAPRMSLAEDGEEAEEEEEDQEGGPPKVTKMDRARREVENDRDYRDLRADIEVEGAPAPADHWYYSGPATSRSIQQTGYVAQSALYSKVGHIADYGNGGSFAANQALYRPKAPPIKHDVAVDIKRAALEEPTREVVARALEHVQVKEISTEMFHDSLVDNNAHSWHFQQRIHVPSVPGSKNNEGGALAYNGIGGIFGVGGMLGPTDGRSEVQMRASQKASGGYNWQGDDLLDAERLLKAGTSWTGTQPESDGSKHDQAQAVLRRAVPNQISASTFLDYDPSHPPAKPRQRQLYIHSWAAYTPEGSKRRMRSAKGQLAYQEWRTDHPTQAVYAEHGVPCFNGKVKCKPEAPPVRAGTVTDSSGGSGDGDDDAPADDEDAPEEAPHEDVTAK